MPDECSEHSASLYNSAFEDVERFKNTLQDEHSRLAQYKMCIWSHVLTPTQVSGDVALTSKPLFLSCLTQRSGNCCFTRALTHRFFSSISQICRVRVCKWPYKSSICLQRKMDCVSLTRLNNKTCALNSVVLYPTYCRGQH